jgi:hypothetical protein
MAAGRSVLIYFAQYFSRFTDPGRTRHHPSHFPTRLPKCGLCHSLQFGHGASLSCPGEINPVASNTILPQNIGNPY